MYKYISLMTARLATFASCSTLALSTLALSTLSFSALALASLAGGDSAAAQPAPPPPPPSPPPSSAKSTAQDAAWHNAQQAYLAGLSAQDGWHWMDGGLMWRRVKGGGTGEQPQVSDLVTIHYTGSLVDGTVFDSSVTRGEPATFPLGRLIPAWQMAVPKMAVGDTIEIAAPASLAYGPRGKGPIPGGATLLFTIELFSIGEPEPTISLRPE